MSHLNAEKVFRKEKISLIDKYKIPLNHFEYDYIEKCNDGKHLERIVMVLRSGEEGYFPDLIKFTENRLTIVKPQSKLLQKISPIINKEDLSKEDQKDLNNVLSQWLDDVGKDDSELTCFKNTKDEINAEYPEIRQNHTTIENTTTKVKSDKKITATDYSAWDKYDPDTEILKMDLDENRLQSSLKPEMVSNNSKSNITKSKSTKKTVQFNGFLTTAETLKHANQEKDKGNECFKIGDYNEALKHYTYSINYQSNLASYTNRALVNIKLKKYQNAIDDCNSALNIEPYNMKALLRKAQALESLNHYAEALEIAEYIISTDPNNTTVQELAEKARKHIGEPLRITRLKIKDVDDNDDDPDEEVVIPIPGSSKMTPPYYITCPKKNLKQVERQIVNNNPLIHIVSVDLSDADDDDLDSNPKEIKYFEKEQTKIMKISNDDKNSSKKEIIGDERKITMTEDPNECGDYANNNIYDIHSPYNFLKMWNSANVDVTLEKHANILREMDVNRIVEVIGCKIDSAMCSKLLKCLSLHLTIPKNVDRLHSLLTNIVNLPRFSVIPLMMSQEDRNYVTILINFLKQHEKPLTDDVCNKLLI